MALCIVELFERCIEQWLCNSLSRQEVFEADEVLSCGIQKLLGLLLVTAKWT